MSDPVQIAADEIRQCLDEASLRDWVAQQRWYASKSRAISGIEIVEGISLTDRLFLALYGTGIRGAAVSVQIGESTLPAAWAPTSEYPGLDQVNVALTLNLRGSGESNIILTVDGRASNTVTVNVK